MVPEELSSSFINPWIQGIKSYRKKMNHSFPFAFIPYFSSMVTTSTHTSVLTCIDQCISRRVGMATPFVATYRNDANGSSTTTVDTFNDSPLFVESYPSVRTTWLTMIKIWARRRIQTILAYGPLSTHLHSHTHSFFAFSVVRRRS